jgi:rhamnulokinase
MTQVYLAFDLGATSLRAVLGREAAGGAGPALQEMSRRPNAPVALDRGLFWDFEGIWQWLLSVLVDLAERGIQPAAIGIDSWSVDYGLLGEDGDLLEPPRSYRDVRTLGAAAALSARIPLRELFLRNGLMAEDITTLCQLLAAERDTPDILSRARRLLFIPDLLRGRLCGAQATDLTLATTSQMYDIHGQAWDLELLSRLGLPAGILPRIVRGSGVLGTLCPEIQRQTGLGPVAIVTGSSHDTAAAFSTVPRRAGTAVLSSGTWSILGIPLESPVWTQGIDPTRVGYEGNTDGSVRLVANIPGMWILEQCRASWREAGLACDYLSLESGARRSRLDGAIDPYDPAFTAPAHMARTVCGALGIADWSAPGAQFDAARGILRGLAHAVGKLLSELSRIAGQRTEELTVISGGSRNELLNEMIAESAGVRVTRGLAEATVAGNVMNQRLALSRAGREASGEQ